MRSKVRHLVQLFAICVTLAVSAAAQDDRILPKPDNPRDIPKNVREMMAKLKADQAKKEHDTMLQRGEDAVEIAEGLERASSDGNRPGEVRDKLDDLEKVVKKIRSDLNGDDAEESESKDVELPASSTDGFKMLHKMVDDLNDELKKTSRFSISARAIDRSNDVLRMIRLLRASR